MIFKPLLQLGSAWFTRLESPDTLRMAFFPLYVGVRGVGFVCSTYKNIHACPHSLLREMWASAHNTLNVYLFTSQIFELLCSGCPGLELDLMCFVSNLHKHLGAASASAILGQGEAPGNAGFHYTQNVGSSFWKPRSSSTKIQNILWLSFAYCITPPLVKRKQNSFHAAFF